eukprot:6005093-Alexandrium_andersonii.AAC.1
MVPMTGAPSKRLQSRARHMSRQTELGPSKSRRHSEGKRTSETPLYSTPPPVQPPSVVSERMERMTAKPSA